MRGTDAVLVLTVAKSRLGQGNRTDGAQQILVDFLGLVQLIVVGGLRHHIIGIMEHQNQIIPDITVILNDKIIEGVHEVIVFNALSRRPIKNCCLPPGASSAVGNSSSRMLLPIVPDITFWQFPGIYRIPHPPDLRRSPRRL